MYAPLPNNEKERLEALKSYHIMDSLSEKEFNAITKLAASICGVPIALISLLDENRQWFKAKFGLNVDETPRNISFCQHAILENKIFEVTNALENPIFYNNPLVTGQPDIRFYAGAPLIDPNGYNLGTLCVIDSSPKKLTEEQKDSLETLASEVVSLIILRKSKKELEDSKNELNAILEGLQEGIVFQNTNAEIIKCNESAEKILGLSYDQMIGKTSLDPSWRSVHEDGSDFPGNTHPAIVTLETQEPLSNIIMGVHKPNNELTWISINSVPIFNKETNDLNGVICTFKDITETKESQDKIIYNQQLLETSQKIAKIGSWEFNLQTSELIWSREHYRIFEIEEPQTQQNLYNLYRSKIHPEDIETLDILVNRAIEEGKDFEFKHRIHLSDDSIKYVLGLGKVEFDKNNKPLKVKGTVQDITSRIEQENQLKASEERLNEAQKLAKIGNWEFNLTTYELFWSDELFNVFDIPFDIPKDKLYEAYRGKFLENDIETIDNHISKCSTLGLAYENIHPIILSDGTLRYIKGRGFARRNAKGEITSLYGTAQDITAEREIKEQLIQEKEKAEQASIAKSDFLANMSHEIRTPLNGIIGFSELLKTTELNQTQEIYSNTIIQSSNSLLNVINDILDFSKIEAGKLELDIQKTQIAQIASEAIDILTYQAQSKNLELLFNIDLNIPCCTLLDSNRVKQVCVNLLGNAIKFTQKGEIELKVELLSKTNTDVCIRFSVRDTGFGINSVHQEKIFEAFSQADTSTTRRFGGTGLGLNISNKLLDLMNHSKLNLISEVGIGSTFFFDLTIPYEENELYDNQELNLNTIKRVLIIDNSEKSSLITKNYLNHLNIEVDIKSDIKETIELINKTQYDIIFIDSKNNSTSSLELINDIISNTTYLLTSCPIVFMTNSIEDDKLYNKCREIGVNYRLLKPIKPIALFEKLKIIAENKYQITPIKKVTSDILSKEKMTILLVDDNQINLLLAKTMLLNILPNAEIIEAYDGIESIKKFVEINPKIVFMDIQMPNMNGYDATIEIRKLSKSKKTPIIALTAGTIKGEREKCLESGMTNYISKPIINSELKDIISIYLLD